MPGMDGLQLLHEIKRAWPHLPVMMVTAYGDENGGASRPPRRERSTFSSKPVDFDYLKQRLRAFTSSAPAT